MKIRLDQLTARQQQFCQAYVGAAQRNAELAARIAGYAAALSHVTGCQLLQKPKVEAAVRALKAVNAQELQLTRKQLLSRLLEAAVVAKAQAGPMAMELLKNRAKISLTHISRRGTHRRDISLLGL